MFLALLILIAHGSKRSSPRFVVPKRGQFKPIASGRNPTGHTKQQTNKKKTDYSPTTPAISCAVPVFALCHLCCCSSSSPTNLARNLKSTMILRSTTLHVTTTALHSLNSLTLHGPASAEARLLADGGIRVAYVLAGAVLAPSAAYLRQQTHPLHETKHRPRSDQYQKIITVVKTATCHRETGGGTSAREHFCNLPRNVLYSCWGQIDGILHQLYKD